MNNNDDDIYLRKDVYDAEQDNLITLIQDLNKRIDDIHNVITVAIASAVLTTGLIAVIWAMLH